MAWTTQFKTDLSQHFNDITIAFLWQESNQYTTVQFAPIRSVSFYAVFFPAKGDQSITEALQIKLGVGQFFHLYHSSQDIITLETPVTKTQA